MRRLRLKDMRQDHDLTQQMLANYLNVARTTYKNYENDERSVPIDILIDLARYYGTSIDYLVGETDETKRYPPPRKSKL